jgi:hypothetical protein
MPTMVRRCALRSAIRRVLNDLACSKKLEVAVVGAPFEASNCGGSGVDRAPRVLEKDQIAALSSRLTPESPTLSQLERKLF